MSDWLDGIDMPELQQIRDRLGVWVERASSRNNPEESTHVANFIKGMGEITRKIDGLIAAARDA